MIVSLQPGYDDSAHSGFQSCPEVIHVISAQNYPAAKKAIPHGSHLWFFLWWNFDLWRFFFAPRQLESTGLAASCGRGQWQKQSCIFCWLHNHEVNPEARKLFFGACTWRVILIGTLRGRVLLSVTLNRLWSVFYSVLTSCSKCHEKHLSCIITLVLWILKFWEDNFFSILELRISFPVCLFPFSTYLEL